MGDFMIICCCCFCCCYGVCCWWIDAMGFHDYEDCDEIWVVVESFM